MIATWESSESSGSIPKPSFGHTIAAISNTKVVIFGGATGDAGKYNMTGEAYLFNVFKREWSLIKCKQP
jgi:protein phosphatase